jgi:hypothetical protein
VASIALVALMNIAAITVAAAIILIVVLTFDAISNFSCGAIEQDRIQAPSVGAGPASPKQSSRCTVVHSAV